MFDNIRSKFSGKAWATPLAPANGGMMLTLGNKFQPTWDKGSVYDNAYSSIKAIANAFVEIIPYAINKNGTVVKDASLVSALESPNDRMSAAIFREALATMALTHRKVYLLVWHRKGNKIIAGGEDITPNNIGGFTFLSGVSEMTIEGVRYYQTAEYGELTEKDVMEVSIGIDPYSLDSGYTPAVAIKKWASVDDYIVAYEAGLFENNAVPDGQFIITANTQEDFKKIVAGMQAKHRGSGKNSNVQYIWRPVDQSTGAVQSAQVEWQPFSQNNRNLALSDIFKQVNEKLDSAYGVPASIRGVSSNNNYASSAVDEAHFMKFTVKPFATKVWGVFTHELNRITAGLGYALTFDLDEVAMADEQKVVAETKKAEIDILTAGLSAGYTAEQVINGFGLDIDFEALGEPKTIVDTSETETGNTEPENEPEAKKKHLSECSCNHSHKKAELNDEQRSVYDDIAEIADAQVNEQTGAVIDELRKQDDEGDFDYEALASASETDDEQNLAFAAAIFAVAVLYMQKTGEASYDKGLKLLEDDSKASGYELSTSAKNNYQKYLAEVGASFNGDTTGRIKEVLARSSEENWNKQRLYNELRAVSDSEGWRIERLAYNEERRAWNMADLDGMQELQSQTGIRIVKKWHIADSGACDFCKDMNGQKENVDNSFLLKDQVVVLEDGSRYVNNFVDMEVAQLHPNCVIGDTKVLADNVELATKMLYSGDIVKLTTKGGRSLSVTPNHILLTDRGWVAAKNLKNTDKIVAHSDSVKGFLGNNTIDGDIPTISEQFISASKSSGVLSVKMPVSPEDFKGDASTDKDVDVIFVDGFLRRKLDPSTSEFSGNLPFIGGNIRSETLPRLSTLDQLLVGILATTNGIVGSTSEGLALLGSGASHPDIHRLTSVSAYNARLIEAKSNNTTTNSKLLGESFLANSRLIEFDDLLSIEIDSVHNTPVYDLQTTSTLYSANGIISSNCRCYMLYEVEG